MRKSDIIITTPKHSTIYAYGTVPESYGTPWQDLDNRRGRFYAPAYVLEVTERNYATILVAEQHPDYKYTPDTVASLLTATEYTLEDYRARQEFYKLHSHWATAEERDVFEAGKEALKPIPAGWRLAIVRTSDIRLLWAEYAERHTIKINERRVAKEAADAVKEAADAVKKAKKDAKQSVLQQVARLSIGYKRDEIEQSLRNNYADEAEVKIPVKVLEKLIAGYSK